MVGADGVHYRVRDGGRFGAEVRRPGIPYLRALVDSGIALGEEAWTAAGLFGSFAVEGGVYLYASAGSARTRAALASRDLVALRAAWAEAYPAAAPLLAAVGRFEDLVVHPVRRVDCERWHDGALVLLGDAAHAMAPNLGQGADSALVDAAVLVDELRRAADLPAALAAYEARRRPAVRWVADTATGSAPSPSRTHPAARWLRDRLLMPAVARLAPATDPARVLQEDRDTLLAIGRADSAPRPVT